MVLKILIVISSLSFFAKIPSSMSMHVNYVKPFGSERASESPCSDVQMPCLTLNEYANNSDEYFVNNTRFYFYPGIHRLEFTLNLVNLYNFSFLGWPNGDQVVTMAVDSSASITWNESWNIEISSIRFFLYGNFTFIMRFEHSQLVQLANISIYGNGYSGCSSIISERSALEFNNSKFIGINGFLGAALMIFASNITFRGSIVFADNAAVSGGSIYLTHNSILSLKGTSLFQNNTSNFSQERAMNYRKMLLCSNINSTRKIKLSSNGSGGTIVCNNSYLEIYHYSNFTGNIAAQQGGAMMLNTCRLNIQGNALFVRNRAIDYCGAMLLQNTNSSVNGNLFLSKNSADWGGALSIIEGNFIIKGYALFDSNYANFTSGALHITSHANFIFCGSVYSESSNVSFDADVLPRKKAKVFDKECSTDNATSFNNSITFLRNAVTAADLWSGSITCDSATIKFIGTVYFNESYSSAVNGDSCNMTFIVTTYFYRNIAQLSGGAIISYDSNIMFSGTVYFEGNVANEDGGAIALLTNSKLIFKPNLNIFFISNHANEAGGALYIKDYQCSLGSPVPFKCFMTIDGPSTSISNISLHFINNSAGSTGSILYGGQLDQCRLYFKSTTTNQSDLCGYQAHSYSDNALETFMNISNITLSQSENEDYIPNLSSTAYKIMFCEGRTPKQPLLLHPGQQFTIPLIAFGQANSTVPIKVFWEIINQGGEYRLSPSSGIINDSCTNVSFWFYTSDLELRYLFFKLYPEHPCHDLVEGLSLRIHVLPCPVGFDLSPADSKCVCAMVLKKLSIQNCYIDSKSLSVERIRNNFWISPQNNETLILHKFPCPLDYCTSNPLNVTLSDPSVQCDFNRTGIVCGQCQTNFSLALGSLHCIPCDNIYIALIVPFALTGIALVALIFLLQLTVSVGTLNGLFFYANIIQANHQAYFPRATINFFTIFASWLNLDLGIETCFYDGMDIYTYSWFQFLFPFYVWFLVGCIILACRYSQSIAQRLGKNPVAVLATLLLMSYSKILSAVIVPLTLTYLTYYSTSNETRSVVWMYDASIPYFGEPKHIALGLFAILCIAVFVLPYISLLFFGHWLQGCSNWWILSWLNKIKPFMDAYYAPYGKHTRYWTGLLLISRLGLFLTFAINATGSESVNILAVSSVSIALLAIQKRVYRHWLKDALESSFLLNLGIFSVATFYLKEESEDDESQLILSSISVGIAFITFLGILLYHISLVRKNYMLPFIQKFLLLNKILRITPVKDQTRAEDKDATELQALPTSTEISVDLREPLLEITEWQATA